MRLEKFYYFIFFVSLLAAVVHASTEESIEIIKYAERKRNATTSPSNMIDSKIDKTTPVEELIDAVVQSQGHENVGERKARQFGYPGFGYGPFVPRPYYGGGFGGGGFGGGGFGGGSFGGGGFQRTRVVTRTRVVNRVRGGGFGGGGYYGGGFYG